MFLIKDQEKDLGIVTGYYEASINASETKSPRYRYPIYGKPRDLVKFNIADFDNEAASKLYVGKIDGPRLRPYYTRREIDVLKKEIDADVLMWADNLVDVFILHIQGSAVARMSDGKEIRIGYAENNGYKFTGIGSLMKDEGLLEPGKASMIEIKKWLNDNSKQADELMAKNERYIFFRTISEDAKGPIGAQGVALTKGRSIAVDRNYIPLGALMWIETETADGDDLNRLVIAQDMGSAIKGVVRADFFWGYGKEAFNQAGRMKSDGRYYIFIPKNNDRTLN